MSAEKWFIVMMMVLIFWIVVVLAILIFTDVWAGIVATSVALPACIGLFKFLTSEWREP